MGLTECGRPTGTLPLISRAEWALIAREWGDLAHSYRVAGMLIPATVTRPTVCQVCWDTCRRWPAWDRNPIQALTRELQTARGSAQGRLRAELWTLARLATTDLDRFDRLVATFTTTGYHRPER